MKQKFFTSINGQILVTQLYGQWNEHNAEQFAAHIKKLAPQFKKQPFGHLLYFDDWQLGGPGTIPIISDVVSWLVDNGMSCAAEIFHPDVLKAYLLDNMVSESRDRFEIHRFDNARDGITWLECQGFRAATEIHSAIHS